MRIEKNTKLLIENKSVSEEEKKLMYQIKKRVLNYRLTSRQKLVENSINLATVIAFVPIVLGFSHFLSYSSRSQNIQKGDSFFHTNLPVFTDFKPKINFETFEYLLKSNTRVNFSSSNLIFGQSNFGITLKKSASLSTKTFNGLSCDFYLLTSGACTKNFHFGSKTSLLTNLARNFDELPAYIQGLNLTQEGTENLASVGQTKRIRQDSLFSNLKTGRTLLSGPENLQNSSSSLFQKQKNEYFSVFGSSKKIYFSLPSISTTKIPLVTGFKNRVQKTPSSELFLHSNQFSKDRLEFYNDIKKFNTELQTLFTQKNISCFSSDSLNTFSEQNRIQEDFSLLNLFVNKISQISDDLIIETILQELEKTNISEDIPNFRFMSGYYYPDMTSEELNWFYFGNSWKRKNLREFVLETNALPASSKEYPFSVKKLPKISLETNQISLRNSTKNEIFGSYQNSSNDPKLQDFGKGTSKNIFYTGPALVLDSQRALDWKPNGKQNLRSWFHTYLSPLNPLRQPLENFFGVYNSPKLLNQGEIPEFSDFAKTSLFSVKWTSGPCLGFFDALEESVVRFSPSSLSFQFPSYQEEGKPSLIRTLNVNLSKNQDTDRFVTLPLLQLQNPSPKLSVLGNGSSGGSESEQLLNYSSDFIFKSKGNPDYRFSTNSFATKNFVTKYASGFYTKTASVYSKIRHSTQVNVDNWEPLTSTWWLIITQFSFAFFIFQVLKSLADNYGRELLGYLLDLIASLGILDDSLKQEIEILLGQRDKGFRIVLESRKSFNDIVGIQKLLPEIYEVVWFLRNSAREFALSKTLPRGILLTGPPGTGKTLLVQALAGEAQVPVVVLSGSSLIEPGESGALKLEKVFQEARDLAPCIVFIDEIDTLAQKRSGVVQNPMGPDELVESLTSFEKSIAESPFEQMQLAREKQESEKEGDKNLQKSSQEEQLSLLTQFLIELDGIQGRNGVIVIGATNRPEVLDPALLRPGRLEKILQVGLPGHQKRVEILKFYGQRYGYEPKTSIPWGYLGDRTAGFTAADLATLMNESTIKAILMNTKHTIETIEHGIDRLTTSESEKYTVFKTKRSPETSFLESNVSTSDITNKELTIASKMAILRLAYYQAGKIVLSSLLETHPKSVVASLWPRRPTIRSAQIATNLQNSIFEFARLCEITDRLVGCYAGKAAEILFIQQFSSSKYAQLSTLGFEDLLFAQKLVYCILEKWSFYSKKSHIQQTSRLASNINTREFREIPEKLDLYTGIIETIQIPPMSQALETQTSSLVSKKKTGITSWNAQLYYSIPWWQQQISAELEFVEKNFTNWSRIYLSNPEQSERNPEWLPPDEFYHSSSGLKNVKNAFANIRKRQPSPEIQNEKASSAPSPTSVEGDVKERFLPQKVDFSWNEVGLLTRDYPGHSLVLQSFNKALVILNQNRELLDRLVVELLYKEILRQPEIEKLLQEFDLSRSDTQENLFVNVSSNFMDFEKEKKQNFAILESSWGSQSRKPMPRWIDFAEFSGETT